MHLVRVRVRVVVVGCGLWLWLWLWLWLGLEVDGARVDGVTVAPRGRVLELDLEAAKGHERHLLDVEVADEDREVVGRLRVRERLGAAVVAGDLLPVERRAPPLDGAREVRPLRRGGVDAGERAARLVRVRVKVRVRVRVRVRVKVRVRIRVRGNGGITS